MSQVSQPAGVALSLSIVSHGQGALVADLLRDLKQPLDVDFELLITLNIPEDERFLADVLRSDTPVQVIRNASPKGFGANHNAAFSQAQGRYFAVVNPDVRLLDWRFRPLLDVAGQPGTGICAPGAFLSNGAPAPIARRFPTWASLFRKLVRRGNSREPDYPAFAAPAAVDWVSGMFMVFPQAAFKAVRGFDERYFMYYEDADLCRRLKQAGLTCWVQPATRIVHDGQYASRRNLRHLYWHVSSALRFLTRQRRP